VYGDLKVRLTVVIAVAVLTPSEAFNRKLNDPALLDVLDPTRLAVPPLKVGADESWGGNESAS
jgi:hypothetical protein